jgi:hypothetical protein
LASLITALPLSLSCAFFHQADPSDISEAVIQGFLTIYVFYRDEVISLMPQPPTWRTRVSLLVWPLAFDPSSMGGPTGNICYRRHGSQVHLGTQAPSLWQSIDTSWGGYSCSNNFESSRRLSMQ